MAPSLDGMAQRGLSNGCTKMNSRRVGAPSGAVESAMMIAEAQGLAYFSSVILVWWCFDTSVWRGFILYDLCMAFCQSVMNK
jgi:hypothetical protein